MNFKDTIQDVDTICCILQKHVKLIQYSCFPGPLKPHYKYGLITFSYKLLICYMFKNYGNNQK
jgi:hypothetical protein